MTKYREILRLHALKFSERNIALSCSVSRNTVSKVIKAADEKGIANYLVVDAGRTQIPTSSVTVLALGPDEDKILDEITGDLKLL